mmetsp:Transcript_46907/g.82690  ORF Transcript_46907/g.82690 Transcript_46907/m.82690 type:complete len:351 (+) Transcript_46907:89-1141(+)
MQRIEVVAGHVTAAEQTHPSEAHRGSDSIRVPLVYTGSGDEHEVDIANGRVLDVSFEADGFTCAKLPAHVSDIASDFLAGAVASPQAVADRMYPVVEQMVKATTGASKVFVFDHIYRNRQRLEQEARAGIKREDKDKATPFLAAPSANLGAHNDYSVRSGITRPHSLFAPYESKEQRDAVIGDISQIEKLGGTGSARVQIVNFWWPLADADATPLALCRWRSIVPRDVQTNRILYKHRENAETYRVHYNPAHEWVYYPQMTHQEALIFKQADSCTESSRFSFHAAFKPPGALGDRVSMEFRTVVLMGDDDSLPADFAKGFIAPHLDTNSGDADARLSAEGREILPQSDEW